MAKIPRSRERNIYGLYKVAEAAGEGFILGIFTLPLELEHHPASHRKSCVPFFKFLIICFNVWWKLWKISVLFATVPSEDSQSPKQLCMEREGNLTAKNISQVRSAPIHTGIPVVFNWQKEIKLTYDDCGRGGGGRIWQEVRLCWICCYLSWNATIVSASVTMASADLHALMSCIILSILATR